TAINQSLKVFPNPVSVEGTNIQFEIPETKSITVYISDNSGKRIATLLDNKITAAGLHNVKWTPSDEISNGIYYLCFVSGMKATLRKMVFIR
ncbi:MAG: T9SS type A sorting domain-containing protein, partial [Chitinophagales bacterium]